MFYDASSYGSTFKIPSINDGLNPNLKRGVYMCVKNRGAHIKKRFRDKIIKCLCGKKKIVKYLATENNSVSRKRKILTQHGGFLGLLASVAIPLLTEVIPSLFKK